MNEITLMTKGRKILNLNFTLFLYLLLVILIHSFKYLSGLFYEALKKKKPNVNFLLLIDAFNTFSNLDMFTPKSM